MGDSSTSEDLRVAEEVEESATGEVVLCWSVDEAELTDSDTGETKSLESEEATLRP